MINPIAKFTDKSFKNIPKGLENIPSQYFGTITECAEIFVRSMNPEQRNRFKQMLDNGIEVGKGVAEVYGVDPKDFKKAIKAILI